MKIYFAGSIRGGRQDAGLYQDIIKELSRYGEVLTEHLGDLALGKGGQDLPSSQIWEQDMNWLKSADLVVAEVTTPSLGVGYELGQARSLGVPALCLFRPGVGGSLSAMIAGDDYFEIVEYAELSDLKELFAKKFS